MNYTATLEALDRTWGRTVTVDDWRGIGDKSAASLTDDDLVIIENFGGEHAAAQARVRRDTARRPPDPPSARVETAPAARPRRAPVEFPDRLWDDDTADAVQALADWADANALKAVPIGVWHGFVTGARRHRTALEVKVDALEREIAELKARPMLKWCGVHVDGQSYQEAQLVTRSGSLWVSTAPTFTTPGTPGSSWRLVVKRGHI